MAASITAALATVLHAAEIGTWAPDDTDGDIYLEHQPGSPDACITLTTLTAAAATETLEDDTTIRVTVRGTVGDTDTPRNTAHAIYTALRGVTAPVTWDPDGDDQITVVGCWPTPPSINRLDTTGRPEWLLRVRVVHRTA